MEEQILSDEVLQLVGFTVGEEKFAIDISEVHEINRFEQISRIPDLPDHVMGVIDLRGMVIPVINLAEKLGIQNQDVTKDTRIIVIGLNGDKTGILVDSVSEVIRVSMNNLDRPPSIIQNVNSEYIRGILRKNDQLIVVLDFLRLFKDFNPMTTKEYSNNSRGHQVASPEVDTDNGMGKIVEVVKAMSEGDFHHEIDGELYGQIGEIARYINATIKKLQTVEPNISHASDKIPKASVQLSEITKITEEATHEVMSQVERVLDSQDLMLQYLETIGKGEDITKTANAMRDMVNENKETLLDIITGLSFQDLTGQKIKAIITLIEEVERRILHLIVTFGLRSKETVKDDNPLKDLSGGTELKQDLVDNILKDFGFE